MANKNFFFKFSLTRNRRNQKEINSDLAFWSIT